MADNQIVQNEQGIELTVSGSLTTQMDQESTSVQSTIKLSVDKSKME